MRDIQGMSVLVTGGGSGLGAGAAEHLVKRGARVTVCGQTVDKIRSVAEGIGPACRWVQADVNDPDSRTHAVQAAVEHGNGRLDGLVQSAGALYRSPVAELDEQRLKDLFQTNVISAMMLTGVALPHLRASRGCVVLFGSPHTQRAIATASPYAATKAALETLTSVLAAELGPAGVRVSCVRPGSIVTELNVSAGVYATKADWQAALGSVTPEQALEVAGTVEDCAETIEYLLRAEWVTGNVTTVDGGLGLGILRA
jgi:3-oxoacyl-[acyl-carrier protein] reductase